MNPLSSLYYIKENKLRSALLIILLMCTVLLFLAGNYVSSLRYYWIKNEEYDAKICLIGAEATDEELKDYTSYLEELKQDDRLIVMERSARGFTGLDWDTTMGVKMGSYSMVFNTPEDLKTAFDHLGLECDLSQVKDRTVIMSKALAAQYDLKAGDKIDYTVDKDISGVYTIAALTDDNSYMLFYVVNDDNLYRANIMSKDMQGYELRNYLREKAAGRRINIYSPLSQMDDSQFNVYDYLFLLCILILSVIHAITVNTVLTGHFIKRTYEFGVYRALGMKKVNVFKKVASELLTMDGIGIITGAGIVLLFSFMINELYYIPKGMFLPYFSSLGVKSFIISNLMVVIPTVIFRSGAMSKADVTEF